MTSTGLYIWIILLVHLLLLPFSKSLRAEHVPDTIQIDAVSVTQRQNATDLAIHKSSIDRLALSDFKNRTLSELLSAHSPLFIKSYGQGSLASATFRGTSASHTRIEWNGIPINNPMLGQADLSLIPVCFIDEVSILYGTSSMIHSTGALGGSILLDNLPEWNKGIRGSLMQAAGSFGTWQTYALISGGLPNLQFTLRLSHEQSENNFRFFNNANGEWNYERMEQAAYSRNGLLGEISYRAGNHSLSARVWLQDADRELPAIMSYEGEGREESQQDTYARASLKWNFYGKYLKSRFTSGYARSSLDYFLGNDTDGGILLHNKSVSHTNSWYNAFVSDIMISNATTLRGTLSFNYHAADITDLISQLGYNAFRSEGGAGISLHHSFNNHISVYSLLRGELVDRDLSPLMPSLGMEIKPFQNRSLTFKLNMGRNYHQPTLNDLYWIPGGNPDLSPEESYMMDFSAQHALQIDSSFTFQQTLTAYISKVDNWIIWRPGDYQYWEAENIRLVHTRGIEYDVRSEYNSGNFKLSLTGNYAYTHTTDETVNSDPDDPDASIYVNTGNQLMYIPLHAGSASLYFHFKKLTASYGFSFTGERFTTPENRDTRHSLPGYGLHHISAGRSFALWKFDGELMLKIDNLLDKDYQAILWRAMPGRSYTFMLTLNF